MYHLKIDFYILCVWSSSCTRYHVCDSRIHFNWANNFTFQTAQDEKIHQLEIERTKLLAELSHKTEINEQLQKQLEDTNLVCSRSLIVKHRGSGWHPEMFFVMNRFFLKVLYCFGCG